jgi:hypothetical protein
MHLHLSSGATLGAEGSAPSCNLVRRCCGELPLRPEFYALADVQDAVAEVKGEGLIKSTIRMYRQGYVTFLRGVDGKIAVGSQKTSFSRIRDLARRFVTCYENGFSLTLPARNFP